MACSNAKAVASAVGVSAWVAVAAVAVVLAVAMWPGQLQVVAAVVMQSTPVAEVDSLVRLACQHW